ncbi:MAG: MotA/TolQ/ExbB proton channel family protein [Dethiobacter sp.]|jgi:chemotaxis protein MotA|nr:MotA/TolQ/ExbB proton channel family protein [Dethiobacter sp.]
MHKFDLMTIAGVLVGLVLVFGAIQLQGDLRIFWDPAGLMITVGGSFGALLVNFRLCEIKTVLQVTRQVFVQREESILDLNRQFVRLAQKARREGLLVLEDELEEISDPFMRNGLQMVIDGFEPEAIRSILHGDLSAMEQRHEMGQAVFKAWGAQAPAFGMIGTLIGLVIMLVNLDDPGAIGRGMAVALLTTFYGVLLANLIFNPMAGKLAIYSGNEVRMKEIIIEALLALQSGINPRLLQEQLKAYFSPAERRLLEAEKKRDQDDTEEMSYNA